MNKYLCIHAHFYQPPRENPWTGFIDEQKAAHPHHDWNVRITKECYAPNGKTQILNNQNQALRTVNNYSQVSFNFGPTLLSWMERADPDTYQSILAGDQEGQKKFSGHGPAIAQGYNHMIMPLANDHDLQTQVIWGIKDFEHRFHRKPEGMWLPETAVDIRALEALAEQGIRFTILAPTQAQRVQVVGHNDWLDVSEGTIDTQLPYLCRLPSGREIVLFFYNSFIANDVAFGELLKNGVHFAERLMADFPEHQQISRLVHIANDGETYGHHHAFGNMALAYMLHHVELNRLAKTTVYGEFLGKNPPVHLVEIIEDTSWSCFHGVERWKAHCGCRLDLKRNWSQEWRKYLRETLDWLRDEIDRIYEQKMAEICKDPWMARNEYIAILLDPSEKNKKAFLSKVMSNKDDVVQDQIFHLLEMQRYRMLMYTSCGWFFDDISGIESIQILQYAGKAMQIAGGIAGTNLEDEFLKRVRAAKSNDREFGDGAKIYTRFVKPAMIPLGK